MKQQGFNPKARWDRHIPETESYDNPQELNEKIEVLAWFKNAKIHPRMFIWEGKIYKIKKVTYNWQERLGQELISYFSVSAGFDLYQISFNSTSHSWKMDKVIE